MRSMHLPRCHGCRVSLCSASNGTTAAADTAGRCALLNQHTIVKHINNKVSCAILCKLQFSGGVESSMTTFVCLFNSILLTLKHRMQALLQRYRKQQTVCRRTALLRPDRVAMPKHCTSEQFGRAGQSTKRCCTNVRAEACTNAICHLRRAHLELVGSGSAAAESLQRRQEVAGRVQGDALRALQL